LPISGTYREYKEKEKEGEGRRARIVITRRGGKRIDG